MSPKSKIESILFASPKPLPLKQISALAGITAKEAEKIIGELGNEYRDDERGFRVIGAADGYQLASAPENAEIIKKLLKNETSGELTEPSLETLTIIAYRGPVSKIDLDRIRGVNCALILRNLAMRGLIESEEDKKKNEVYYSVTGDFLKFLGLGRTSELPDYEKLNQAEALNEILSE